MPLTKVDYDPFAAPEGGLTKVDYDPFTTQATPAAPAIARPDRSWVQAATDTYKGVATGVGNVISGAGTLYGLATGDMDNAATRFGGSVRDYWQERQSDALKADKAARSAAIDQADGILGKAGTAIKETIKNPSLLADTVAENIATFIPAAGAARVGSIASKAAGATAATAARVGTGAGIGVGAVQQGADVAQGAYDAAIAKPDAVWNTNAEYAKRVAAGESPDAVKHSMALESARIAMPAAAAVSVATQFLPGASMAERFAAGATAKAAKVGGKEVGGLAGRAVNAAKGVAGEGAQEALEEGGGQFAANITNRNIDQNQSLSEGVGESAGMGFVGGAGLGGIAGAAQRPRVIDGVLKQEGVQKPVQPVGTSGASTDTSEPLSGVAAPLSGDIPIQPQTPVAQMAANMRMEAQVQRANAKTVLGRAAADATDMQADAVQAADPFDLSSLGATESGAPPVDGFTRLADIAQSLNLDPDAIVAAARADVGDDPQYSLDGLDDRILTTYAQSLAPTVQPAQAQDGFPSEGAGSAQPTPVQAPSVEAQSGQANPVEGSGLAGESPVVAGDEPALASVPAAGAQAQEVAGNASLGSISDIPFQQIGDLGLAGELTAGMVSPADWNGLRAAGLVQSATSEDGSPYEYVPAAALWDERERRSNEARSRARASVMSAEEQQQARERRASNYDRMAQEQEDLGDLGDLNKAAELRAMAARVRAGLPAREKSPATAVQAPQAASSPSQTSGTQAAQAPESAESSQAASGTYSPGPDPQSTQSPTATIEGRADQTVQTAAPLSQQSNSSSPSPQGTPVEGGGGSDAATTIRSAFQSATATGYSIGNSVPVSVTVNGRTRDFIARQKSLSNGKKPAPIELRTVEFKRLIAGNAPEWVTNTYKLDGNGDLKEVGLARPATDYERKFGESKPAAAPAPQAQAAEQPKKPRSKMTAKELRESEAAKATPKPKNQKTSPARKPRDLLDVIARSGGLNREAFRAQGVDPAEFNRQSGIRYVFRKNGGMSLSDLREWMQQEGYLPRDPEDGQPVVDDNDALDLFDRALRGGGAIYADDQWQDVAEYEEAKRQADAEYEAEMRASPAFGDGFDSAMAQADNAAYVKSYAELTEEAYDLGATAEDIIESSFRADPSAYLEYVIERLSNENNIQSGAEEGNRQGRAESRPQAEPGTRREGTGQAEEVRPTSAGLFGTPTAREVVDAAARDRAENKAKKPRSAMTSKELKAAEVEKAAKAQRETITPANDTLLGNNSEGVPVYERADGFRYRMRDGRVLTGGLLITEAEEQAERAERGSATHADPGEAPEVVTPAVIAEAAKTIEGFRASRAKQSADIAKYEAAKEKAKKPRSQMTAKELREAEKAKQSANDYAKYDEAAKAYGRSVREDGAILKDGKESGLFVREKGKRLRIEDKDGKLTFSGAPNGEALGKFMESFWFAEKVKAKPEQPAAPHSAKTSKAAKAPAKGKADDRAAALASYFKPGNIIKSYSGYDEVLSYRPADGNRSMQVDVHEVRKVNGEWVRVGKPQDARWHSTLPDARELKAGPIDTVPAGDATYTEPRADGRAFPNAPLRGAQGATATHAAPVEAAQPDKKESKPAAQAASGKLGNTDTALENVEDTGFYSAALRAVEEGKSAPKKGSSDQWKGWLDGAVRRGEMKQSERDWLGLDAWLNKQERPVTREQLADFIRANEVRIEEVTLGQDDAPAVQARIDAINAEYESIMEANGGWQPVENLPQKDRARIEELTREHDRLADVDMSVARNSYLSPKFDRYQLPGGKNYRELLLTLPHDANGAMEERRRAIEREIAAMGFASDEASIARRSELRAEADSISGARNRSEYRSSHFDQPNILAHVRFNERTDADGKRVLFIEEIQSDWHQEGRKRGYKDGSERRDYRIEPQGDRFVVVFDNGSRIGTYPTADAAEAASGVRASARRATRSDAVPDAPFKSTDDWAMLAFKRMVRHAAENGFDRIAWTTGEQQFDRYPGGSDEQRAARLAGMRGFYDKILPSAVNKWAKRFGGKVGATTIGDPNNKITHLVKGENGLVQHASASQEGAERWAARNPGTTVVPNDVSKTVHAIDLTPSMRDAALQGMPLFNREDSATEWLPYIEADESRTNGDIDADRLGLRKAVNGLLGKSGLRVEYLRGYAGLPEGLRNAVESRNAMGRKGQTAALYDPETKRVFVFTHVVRTPERAAWNAAHEIAGHDGLRKLLGKRLDEVLELADKNPTVSALADEIAVQRKLTPAQRLLAVEEALAELAAAVRTGDYGRIQEKYKISVPEGIRARVAQVVTNFLRRLKELLQNRTGVVFKDADVRALLENAWQAAQGNGASMSVVGPNGALEQVVFHGTPHTVDRFSLQKIGTGEGAQAFGYGLYFASQKAIADSYRKNLSADVQELPLDWDNLKPAPKGSQAGRLLRLMQKHKYFDGADLEAAGLVPEDFGIQRESDEIDLDELRDGLSRHMADVKGGGEVYLLADGSAIADDGDTFYAITPPTVGNLYRVDVPEDSDLLDWDKLLSEQPEKVRDALKAAGFPSEGFSNPLGKTMYGNLVKRVQSAQEQGWSETLGGIAVRPDAQQAVSEYLNSLGIPGLRYADGSTRNNTAWTARHPDGRSEMFISKATAQGYADRNPGFVVYEPDQSHNYVIWDEAAIGTPESALESVSDDTRDTYNARIDALFNGDKAALKGVRILDRSDVLGMMGLGEGPMNIAEGKVIEGRYNHKLTAADWKKVPGWLENPALVFQSEQGDGSRLVFIAPETVGGEIVRMIVQPNAKNGADVHLLVNAYDAAGGNPLLRWAQDDLLRYVDTKKSPALAARSGRRLPGLADKPRGSAQTILSQKDLGKYRAEAGQAAVIAPPSSALESTEGGSLAGMDLSQTKVVGRDGKPLTVFHGTTSAIEGDYRIPAFFSESREGAEWFAQDGGTVNTAKLDIRNPLDISTQSGSFKFIQMARKAGVKVESDIADNGKPWDFYAPEIAKHSPYDGTNVADLVYIPKVRAAMVASGYDGLKAADPLENGDHDVWVALRADQIQQQPLESTEDQTQSEAFKRWFGDSKVVDADGKPLVVYHGGAGGVRVFEPERAGSVKTADWGSGVYFTPAKWQAQSYMEDSNKAADVKSNALWEKMEETAARHGTGVMYASMDLSSKKITQAQYDEIKAIESEWRKARQDAEKNGSGEVYAAYLRIENPLIQRYDGITDPYLREHAEAKGHDGIIIVHDDGSFDEIVVFRPNQIKSADKNNGNFDPDNPSILESVEGFELSDNPTAADVRIPGEINLSALHKGGFKAAMERIGQKFTSLKPKVLALIPLQELDDFSPKRVTEDGQAESLTPAVGQYIKLQNDMQAFRNRLYIEYDKVAQDLQAFASEGTGFRGWMGNRVSQQGRDLFALMHDSTVAGVDPSEVGTRFKEPEKAAKYRELQERYNALPEKGRELFKATRDAYAKQTDLLDEVLEGNVKRTAEITINRARRRLEAREKEIDEDGSMSAAEKKKARDAARAAYDDTVKEGNVQSKMAALRSMLEKNRVPRPYFPLKRYGEFWVSVLKDGKLAGFSKFQSAEEQQAYSKEMTARGFETRLKYQRDKDAKTSAMIDPTFVAEVEGILAGLPNEIRDEVWQAYLERMPDMSLRKSFIHRKNVPGYHFDALKAFGSSMFHSSYQLSRLKYGVEMQEALDVLGEQANDLRGKDASAAVAADMLHGELGERHAFIMNPTNARWAQTVTGAAFIYSLGANPAHLFLNATQTIMLGLPVMGSRYGFKRATAAIGKAAQDFAKGRGHVDKASLTDDERRAFKEMQASGLIEKSQAHDMAGIGAEGVEYSAVRKKVMDKVGWFMHQSERFNREVTAIAGYRLARAEGKSHEAAVAAAEKMVYTIHFDYSNSGRARIMQGDLAKALLVFRNYQANMIYRLFRDIHQSIRGESVQVKREARKQLGAIFGMYGLFAGAMGVPFYGLAMALAGLGDDDDDPVTAEQQFVNGTVEFLGPTAAKILLRGLPGTAFDIDLTERVGMGNLWFRSPNQEMEGRDAYYYWMEQLLGAGLGPLKGFFDGVSLARQGQFQRGLERMAPAALRNPLQAIRQAQEGGVTSLDGDLIKETTGGDYIAKALGFQPLSVSEQYDKNSNLKNADRRLSNRREKLLNRYFLAVQMGDDTAEVMADVQAFNLKNPEYAITRDTFKRSARLRNRNKLMSENGIVMTRRMRRLQERIQDDAED